MGEHMIPLTNYVNFTNDFYILIKDAIEHYKEVIAQIQSMTFSSSYTIKMEEI